MKLARFDAGAGPRTGVVIGDEIADVAAIEPSVSSNPVAILGDAGQIRDIAAIATRAPRRPVQSVRLLAPSPFPRKILGIGLNYRDHAKETGREPPSVQMWFNKQVTSLHDPGAPVILPAASPHLDYEVELVVVIGRRGKHVPRERAHEIIAGFTVGCDLSVRDWQRASPTMIMGKGFDTHAPIGPFIVTPDEAGHAKDMLLECRVNGEVRQKASGGEMIFDVASQIEYLTTAFPLEPGDLIFTGTPAGVGAAFSPPKFLVPGDRVSVSIEPLGGFEFVVQRETPETCIG